MNKETIDIVKRIERIENKLELTTPKQEWTKIGELEWSEDLGEFTWNEAMAKAKELGARVPTRTELVDLYDNHYDECQELIKKSPSYDFWSATEINSTNAWYVYLNSGFTNYNNKTNAYQLRCVR